MVAIVSREDADGLLECWRALPEGGDAAMIGDISNAATHVQLRTPLGGERILEELEDDPLPRIC